jgi:hypothetical protein
MATITKKAVQQDGVDKKAMAGLSNSGDLQKASRLGVFGDNLVEPIPNFIETASEKVYSNASNSWIVLGRDRPAGRETGFGGKGDTQAASIDIVCGRLGHEVRTTDIKTGEKLWVDPDFKKDAARVYMSQKTNLDENFGLTIGRVGTSSAKSGIGMKADAIRFIAREGIKLVTSESTKNSQGGDVLGIVGVDIIAGNMDKKSNNTDLQPMAKGDNLAEAMRRLTKHLEKLNGLVTTFITHQTKYNIALMNHWHNSPFFASPTTPSITLIPDGIKVLIDSLTKTMTGLVAHKANIAMYKQTYLQQSGKKYICSRYNNVN